MDVSPATTKSRPDRIDHDPPATEPVSPQLQPRTPAQACAALPQPPANHSTSDGVAGAPPAITTQQRINQQLAAEIAKALTMGTERMRPDDDNAKWRRLLHRQRGCIYAGPGCVHAGASALRRPDLTGLFRWMQADREPIRYLKLGGIEISLGEAQLLATALADNAPVTELAIMPASIGPDAAKLIIESLETNSSVRLLTIVFPREAAAASAESLARLVHRNRFLEALFFDGDPVGPLMDALRQNITIKELTVGGHWWMGTEKEPLLDMIKDNRTLQSLTLLRPANLDAASKKRIADALERNTTITEFSSFLTIPRADRSVLRNRHVEALLREAGEPTGGGLPAELSGMIERNLITIDQHGGAQYDDTLARVIEFSLANKHART